MIVKPVLKNEEFFKEVPTSIKKATMYGINFGKFEKPIIRLRMCSVKYPLGRFNKFVVEHNESEIIKNFNNAIKTALGSEAHKFIEIKPDELGIKILDNITKAKVEKLEKFDVVDVLVEFNNCWLMSNKIYVSFVLKDLKLSDEKPQPEEHTTFLFSDIGE